jgi:hypothetical protein
MWLINEVLCFDEKLYRILSIHEGEIFWINLDDKKAFPELVLDLNLQALMDESRLQRSEDPFVNLQRIEPNFDSIEYRCREERYSIIQQIVFDNGCFERKERAQRIKNVEQSGVATKATVYNLLRLYWQKGQTPNALIPNYQKCGAPGKTRSDVGVHKAGRPRKFGNGQGVKVNTEIERLFRRTIEKYLLTPKAISVVAAFRRFTDLFEQYYPQITPENRPTIRQFRYFYDREYVQSQRLITQNEPGIFKKDIRPLTSTATAHVLGPGSRYEIDATIADIYLVDDEDSSKIIGRPTLYFVIDVFSRMITGFYVGLDNPSYVVAMQAIINACSDKTEICKKYNINISSDEWPCIGLPDVILADRGEMMSHQVDSLVSEFNLRIESAPPRRGDAKGIVESCFRTIQAEFKPYVPGIVQGNRVKKHGEKDYRLDATISISDFTEIIIRTILFRNNHHVMDKYDRSADIPSDVASIPLELWRWGLQNRTGGLRQANMEVLRVALLPRRKASLSPFGVNLWGMYYACSELLRSGWLHRSPDIKRPQHLEAAYDPGCADIIYFFPQENRRTYWTCALTDRSRQFRGLSFWQVWDIQAQEKHHKADKRLSEDVKRRELDAFIQEKLTSSLKKLPSVKV